MTLLETIIQPGANIFIWIFVIILGAVKALTIVDIFKKKPSCEDNKSN